MMPFFAFPSDVRRIRCTSNAIESVYLRLRRIVAARSTAEPLDDAPRSHAGALRVRVEERDRRAGLARARSSPASAAFRRA
jgi:transposase-like protein